MVCNIYSQGWPSSPDIVPGRVFSQKYLVLVPLLWKVQPRCWKPSRLCHAGPTRVGLRFTPHGSKISVSFNIDYGIAVYRWGRVLEFFSSVSRWMMSIIILQNIAIHSANPISFQWKHRNSHLKERAQKQRCFFFLSNLPNPDRVQSPPVEISGAITIRIRLQISDSATSVHIYVH
jgi:hypothetical protein